MTLTLELPDEVAARLDHMPEEERNLFSITAIADALTCWQYEIEPEEGDWIQQVNQAIEEIEAGQAGISIEEFFRQWDAKIVARKAKEAA